MVTDRFSEVLPFVQDLVIRIVFAVIIVLIGILVAKLVRKVIVSIVNALPINRLLEPTGFTALVEKSGHSFDAGKFFGWFAKWIILIVFLMWALEVLGLVAVNVLLLQIVYHYIPLVIIGSVVLFIGLILAEFVRKVVAGSTRATNMGNPGLVAGIAKVVVVLFTILLAMDIVGFGEDLVYLIAMGLIGMVMIAGGVAFGLGGRDAAADALRNFRRGMNE